MAPLIRRHFYSHLSEQNSEKTKIITNLEIQTQLKDSEAIPLFHETQRLRTELDSLQAHSKWLEKELQQKSEDYNRLQQESRDRAVQLHMQLDQTTNEKKTAEVTLQAVKQIETGLQEKVEQLSQDLLSAKQELVAVQENHEDQLREERRLVQLQKDHLERWQQRYNDVVRQNEGMKEAASRAMEANEDEINRVRLELETEFQRLLDEQKAEYEKKLEELNGNPFAVRTVVNNIDMASDDGGDEEPISLTDLYTKLEETKQALQQEKIQCKHWQLQFRQVEQDILDYRPKMLRQREEYELAVDKMNDYEQRLRQALLDRDSARDEARDAQQEISTMRLVLATKKRESEELAKQVQGLLASRSGGKVDSDVPLSIQQMQNQNQRLLAEQQRLNLVIHELERKLDTDDLRRKLEDLETELSTLREEQRDQESLATQIAMQRDLYKSLLASKDSNMLGSFQDGTDALAIIKQQSERSRALEERNKQLENQLAAVKSDFDSACREKEGLSERVGRYESVLSELRSSVDSLERQIVSHRSEAARKASEADYHKEKSDRLEAAFERSRGEIVSITNVKSNLERMNVELQRSLSQANSSLSNAEEESRQIESKLRLLETQLETAKAFETRLVEENHQLRADIARHGSVNENLRRIEATLASKAGSEKEKLSEEVAHLSSLLESERNKHSLEIEKLNIQIEESDLRVKDLESLSAKAQADLLKADKSSLEAKAEVNVLFSKCKSLESQLEMAAKKLGETEDGEDADVSLQARVDSLILQVETKDAELVALTEKVKVYQKLSKDTESELNALKALTEENATKQAREVTELEDKVKSLSALNCSKQEIIQDLTNDLAGHRDERTEIETKLTSEISTLKATLESRSKDFEALEEANLALKLDIESLRNEVIIAQKNYERELGLHSQARSLLRDAQEKLNKEEQINAELKSSVEILQKEGEGQREVWLKEKSSLQESFEIKEETLKHAREQNAILHAQLESLRALTQASYSEITEGDDGIDKHGQVQQKEISELRELVRFLRSENELILSELANAKRSVERERSASNVVKRNLDQSRAELNALLTESRENGNQGSEALQKLQDTEAQVKVLTDSNKLMREEKDRLQKEIAELQNDIAKSKESSKPAEAMIRELQSQVAGLSAERDGLKRDLDTWKDRVQNLVSKFNQIDPEEHSRLKEKIREMEAEKESLNAWKKTTEEESLRIRNIAKNLNQKAREQKSLIDEKTKEVEKLKAENEKFSKEKASDSKILDEHQELKVTVERLRKDAASHKTQLEGANEQNNRLRETLRKFQSTIRDLKDNEKKLSDQLASFKDPSAGHEMSTGSSKPPTGQASLKQAEPAEQMPSIPEDGFNFGPSVGQIETQQVVETKTKLSLRAEAEVFSPGRGPSEFKPPIQSETTIEPSKSKVIAPPTRNSVPDPTKTSSEIASSQPIRQMSGEKKELSMKEKLIEKKRKLEEAKLRKRKLELEASQNIQPDPIVILEKRAKTEGPSESGTTSGNVLKSSEGGLLVQDDEPETDSTQDAEKLGKDGNDTKESDGDRADRKETTADTAPHDTKINMVEAQPASTGQTDRPSFGSFGAPALASSVTAPAFDASRATPNTSIAAPTFGNSGASPFGGGTSFLDMKPPGSSSSVAFSFGTSSFKLPTPSQLPPAPSASPFNAFGPGTNPFGSFGSSSVPSSQSLFDSQIARKNDENEKDEK